MGTRGRAAVDVVIVGAGAAGLGAARAARDLGLSFVVFEAMGRIGGRAFTDVDVFGFPWDRGCHWLHSGSINPMRELADRYGFRYRKEGVPWRLRLAEGWATEAEQAAIDGVEKRAYEAILAAGRAERDVAAVSEVGATGGALEVLRASIHAEWGTPLDGISTLDASRYRDTGENWPVEDGYGALVARHAAGVPVEVGTAVERIDWGGESVRVTTGRGTVEAGAVVVTVSTDVLAAGTIAFEPALPEWKLAAAAAIPLGSANKVAFAVDGRYLGVEEPANVTVPVPGAAGTMMSFRLRPFGRNLADGYLAGPLGRELEAAGEEAMFETALGALTGALGSEVGKRITARACSRWGAEPTIRGAYGPARPGEAHQREALARPVEDRLFFAGEATSPEFFTTCHGAHLSGLAAARQVAQALGRVRVREGAEVGVKLSV